MAQSRADRPLLGEPPGQVELGVELAAVWLAAEEQVEAGHRGRLRACESWVGGGIAARAGGAECEPHQVDVEAQLEPRDGPDGDEELRVERVRLRVGHGERVHLVRADERRVSGGVGDGAAAKERCEAGAQAEAQALIEETVEVVRAQAAGEIDGLRPGRVALLGAGGGAREHRGECQRPSQSAPASRAVHPAWPDQCAASPTAEAGRPEAPGTASRLPPGSTRKALMTAVPLSSAYKNRLPRVSARSIGALRVPVLPAK